MPGWLWFIPAIIAAIAVVISADRGREDLVLFWAVMFGLALALVLP